MSRWIFLRHGESEANRDRVFSGHQDVPLTAKGESQAREAGLKIEQALGGQPLDRVLSSDLQRAVRTAELAIQAANLLHPIQQTEALRERNLGDWQGQSIDELKAQGSRSVLHQWTGRAPGGESLAELAHRSLTFLAPLDDKPATLLVGHGGLIRVLLGLLDGTERTAIGTVDIPNAVPIERDVSAARWCALLEGLTG